MRIHPSAFGAEDSLSISGFPEVVDPEYLDAWSEYIKTQTAFDLYKRAPHPYGMTYAVLGFLSYLSTVHRKFLLKSVQSPLDISLKEFIRDVKVKRSELKHWLQSLAFDRYFQLSDIYPVLDSNYNLVGNILNVEVALTLVYVPKPSGGKPAKVGSILHAMADAWSRGKRPVELFSKSPLVGLYENSTAIVKPDVYPNIKSLLGKRRGWYDWNEKLGIETARVQGNALAIRITTTRMPIFISTKAKTQVSRRLTNLAVSNIK